MVNRWQWRPQKLSLFALVCAVMPLACSEVQPTNRRGVSGVVSFKGKPLDRGTIQFVATRESAGEFAFSGAKIANGIYSIPIENGLSPGTYRVLISSGIIGGDVAEEPSSKSNIPIRERIPAAFNTQSKVLVNLSMDSANTFDFEIP